MNILGNQKYWISIWYAEILQCKILLLIQWATGWLFQTNVGVEMHLLEDAMTAPSEGPNHKPLCKRIPVQMIMINILTRTTVISSITKASINAKNRQNMPLN